MFALIGIRASFMKCFLWHSLCSCRCCSYSYTSILVTTMWDVCKRTTKDIGKHWATSTVPIQHLQAAQTLKMRVHDYYGFCNGLTFLEVSNRDVLNFNERLPSRETCNSSDVRINCNIHEAEIDIPLWNSVVEIPLNPLLQNASSKVAGMHHRQQMAAVRTALM